MKEYEIAVNSVVYVLLPPSDKKPYRYETGIVHKIIDKHSYSTTSAVDKIIINETTIEEMRKTYRIRVRNINDREKRYLAQVDRIYTMDELDDLKTDIDNYNKLCKYKVELKKMYENYISTELKGWDTKHYLPF